MIDITPYVLLTIYLLTTVLFLRYGAVFSNAISHDFRPLIVYFVLVFSLFVAFLYGFRDIDRFHGGVDTRAYQEIFMSLDLSDWNTFFNQRVEKGYVLLMWIVKSLGLSFAHFMVVFYLILCLFFYKISLHLTRNWVLIFSILLLAVTFLESFNISRMSLGTFVFFYAFINLSLGRIYRAIFYTLLAISLQVTFIWGGLVLIYFLLLNKIKSKYRMIFHLIVFSFAFVAVEIFKEILSIVGYLYYLKDSDIEPSYLNYIFVVILITLYYLFLRGKVENRISVDIFSILPTMLFIVPLYSALPIAYRFNYIYYPMIAFVIPDIYKATKYSKNGRLVGFGVAFVPVLYVVLKVYGYFTGDISYLLVWDVVF